MVQGSRFRLQFLGPPDRAGRLASLFLQVRSQEGDDGKLKWRQHLVEGVAIYFNPDRSPRQLRIELATKKLFGVVKKGKLCLRLLVDRRRMNALEQSLFSVVQLTFRRGDISDEEQVAC